MVLDEVEEPAAKKQRVEQGEEAILEVEQQQELIPALPPESIDEEAEGFPDDSQTETANLHENRLMDVQPEEDSALNTGYGPARVDRTQHEHAIPDSELNQALRRSHEILDTGNLRAVRGPFGLHTPKDDDGHEEFEVFVCSSVEEKAAHYESFMASHKKNEEIRDKDLTEDEQRSLEKGMRKEWDKQRS